MKKLKIAMMTSWNATSGVSTHAELVGNEWVRQGHKLKVFSFTTEDFHGSFLVREDEDFVKRCFGTSVRTNYLNPAPFLEEEYDYFIVQDIGMIPCDKLSEVFHEISKKTKKILVNHDGAISRNSFIYQFDWDKVVIFDDRYEKVFKKIYKGKLEIIPFPCHTKKYGNKRKARQKLGLPLDKKIIFCFGQKWRTMHELIHPIIELNKKYPLKLYIISGSDVKGYEELESRGLVEIRKGLLEDDELYDWLHASDVTVFNKQSTAVVVLSSTTHLVLGSGCPVIARDSNFFEKMPKEVLKYKNMNEFKKAMISVFKKDARYRKVMHASRKFVRKYSSDKIAKQFIKMLERL